MTKEMQELIDRELNAAPEPGDSANLRLSQTLKQADAVSVG